MSVTKKADDDEQDVGLRLLAVAAQGVGVKPLNDPADAQRSDRQQLSTFMQYVDLHQAGVE